MKEKFATIIATWFGTGLAPFAPGTVGTFFGLPLAFLIAYINPVYGGVALFALLLISVWSSEVASAAMGIKDPGSIVIDEVAGISFALFLIEPTMINVVLAFLLFRFFDILKPWPIKLIDEKIGGGWGIVLDDVLAGIFANIILQILIRTIPLLK